MYVCVLDLNTYCKDNFYFLDTKPNIVIEGIFTKVMYTHQFFTLNATYFDLPFEKSNETLKAMNDLESTILDNYCKFLKIQNKTAKYSITKHLKCRKFKINVRDINVILKISGIWESSTEYGITYKIIEGSHLSV
jgi:hypothetical protein